MSKAFISFDICTRHTRDLNALHNFVKTTSPSYNADHLLRSEYALIVSALDKYIHDIVREKIIKNFFNPDFQANIPLEIPMQSLKKILSETNLINQELVLDYYVREKLSKLSFQSPSSIDSAMKLIGQKAIWSQLEPLMSMPPLDIRNQLALYINRRNKIVHESDFDTVSSTFTPIDVDTVNDCHDFICSLIISLEIIIG